MNETVVLKNGAVMDARTGRIVAHNNPPMRDPEVQHRASRLGNARRRLIKRAAILAEALIVEIRSILITKE